MTLSPQTFVRLTYQIAIPFDYNVWSTVERDKITQRNTSEELKARITAVFTNLNKGTFGNACMRTRGHLEALMEANCEFPFCIMEKTYSSHSVYFNVLTWLSIIRHSVYVDLSFLSTESLIDGIIFDVKGCSLDVLIIF